MSLIATVSILSPIVTLSLNDTISNDTQYYVHMTLSIMCQIVTLSLTTLGIKGAKSNDIQHNVSNGDT